MWRVDGLISDSKYLKCAGIGCVGILLNMIVMWNN